MKNMQDVLKVLADIHGELKRMSHFNFAETPYFLDLNWNSQTSMKLLEDKLCMVIQQMSNFESRFPGPFSWISQEWIKQPHYLDFEYEFHSTLEMKEESMDFDKRELYKSCLLTEEQVDSQHPKEINLQELLNRE